MAAPPTSADVPPALTAGGGTVPPALTAGGGSVPPALTSGGGPPLAAGGRTASEEESDIFAALDATHHRLSAQVHSSTAQRINEAPAATTWSELLASIKFVIKKVF